MKIILILLFFSINLNAQTTVNNAWDRFFKNDRETSRKLFTQLANKPETADEANLALCLLGQVDRPLTEGFSYLNKFYKTSKNPQPYLFAMWSSPVNYSGARKSAEQLEFYRNLSQRKDIDGTLLAMAQSLIGKHYEEMKKNEEADLAYSHIGELENWLITGEYENISTSGFDKSYDVLNHPELTAAFTGKANRKFGWRTVPYTRHDRWFDFEYYNSYKNALQFAQTFVKSGSDTIVQLRTGVSGSVKVWVNDKLVLSEAEERNNDLDSYINTVKLNRGYNRILVQIGESYANRSNFMVRLTDQTGRPLTDISTTSVPQLYAKETAFVSLKVEPLALNYFEKALEKQPDNYLSKLMLAKLYLRQGDIFEAQHLLEDLKSRFPESTYLNLMLIELYSMAGNRTGIETSKESIKTNDPESSYALELAYSDFINQKDYSNASLIVKKLEKMYGEDENVMIKKISIAQYLNNQLEVVDLVERAYPVFPNSATIVGLKYVNERDIKKNQQATSILQTYIDNNDDYTSAKFVAQLYIDRGQTDLGLAIYKKEIQCDPIAIGIYKKLGDQYMSLQQYDLAEKTYLQVLEIDPNYADVYAALGQVYNMRKQKEKSILAYKKSLQISPNDYENIQALRRLQDKKSVFDYFVQPDIKALVLAAPSLTAYPDDHVVILNNEVQKVVYENGGSEEKHFYTAKILTQKGLEGNTEFNITYNNDQNYNIELAEVVKANGTKVPADQNNNQVVFTNLEVGDIINLRYKIENYFVGAMSSHFWDSFYFSSGYPCVQSKYSLLIHHDKPFKSVFSQAPVSLIKSKKDEFDLYVWHQGNQKALVYEDKMPPVDDVTNKLYVSSIPDWQFIANWYNDIAVAKARSSYEVKSVVNSLFRNKPGLDQLAKIKIIYKYITGNIAYSSVPFRQSGIVPQNPSAVINTRMGDCKDVSTLFVAMCKEVGVEAQLALVSTRNNGQNTMLLPSIDFNHCIAKAIINKHDYWVELTSKDLPFNTFSNAFLNSNVLEINKGLVQLTKFNPLIRKHNTLSYNTKITLKDVDMIVNETNLNTGSIASYLRAEFSDLSNKDQLKKMKEQVGQIYSENEVYSLDFTNLNTADANSDTVGTASSYKLLNVCKSVAGLSIFSIPWSNKIYAANLQVVAPRNYGVDLTQLFSADESDQQLTLELPEGKSIVQPLKTVSLSNDFADYTIASSQLGNTIVLKRQFSLKKDFVPLDKVEAFKLFYKQMAEADEQQLAMK